VHHCAPCIYNNNLLFIPLQIGTSEPRVVRLFPSQTCSCPSQGNCYHVVAAKLSIGLVGTESRRPLNLTQLRKNKRKRPDKTAGRKCPRTLDVDVVAAGDVDDDDLQRIREQVQPAVHGDADVEPDDPPVEETELPALEHVAIRTDVCDTCGAEDPPPRKRRQPKEIHWVGCDLCPRWFHILCVGIKNIPNKYICDMCL